MRRTRQARDSALLIDRANALAMGLLSVVGACTIGFVAAVSSIAAAEPDGVSARSDDTTKTKLDAEFDATSLEFFEKHVRPLLAKRCYECHSSRQGKTVAADGKHEDKRAEPQGGLRVDSRAALLAGGDTGPAIVPGDAKQSLLIDAVNYGDVYQMPPKSKLAPAEIATLTRWVEMGAPWPPGEDNRPPGEDNRPPGEDKLAAPGKSEFDIRQRRDSHWAWQPVAAVELPPVSRADWPRDPLDHFIMARLDDARLSPAARADKATLLRRASFDLTGLPPSSRELADFLNDDSPDAFRTVVDRLLKSPHFAERWARHWLDLVRYAETFGHEFDYPVPHANAYRDYVIRALREDVPYDQFVIEHLAGDLLTEPRRHPTEGFNESVIGTGFWWLGEATHAPVDVRGDEAARIDNQIDVMSKTFLGLTVACARCHDHKFDAISTRDYYALAGFLQSSRRDEAQLDPHGRVQQGRERIDALRRQGDRLLREALPDSTERAAVEVSNALLAVQRLRDGEGGDGDGERLEQIAEQFQLSPRRLRDWDAALQEPAASESPHPFAPWIALTAAGGEFDGARYARHRQTLLNDAARARKSASATPLLADFNHDDYGDWFVRGGAFGKAPTRAGQWDVASAEPRFLTPGWANGQATSVRLQGSLRSPTFKITHSNIFFRIRGKGVRLRVVVDGYFMDVYSGLLFKGMTSDIDTKGKTVWRRVAGDLGRYIGHNAYIEVLDRGDGFAAIDEIRFSNGPAPHNEANPLARQSLEGESIDSWVSLAGALGRQWRQTLRRWRTAGATSADARWIQWMSDYKLLDWKQVDGRSLADRLGPLREQIQSLDSRLPAPRRVLSITDGSPENEHVHIRGNHKILSDEVPRRLLATLGGKPLAGEGSGRLRLAEQIVEPANPLTARVMVNRIWHHLLGRGIVASVDNFGALGQPPTHPKLLDHLAHRFVRDGWSIKQLIRSIMLSSTYQMASLPQAAADAKDPENRLLHRARIRRLEGEAIRDAILAVSGRLDAKVLGGSVPVHVTAFMQGRGRPGGNGPVDGAGRRSLYTEVRRNFLSPMMLAFDVPIPFSTMGRRNVSNVPAQALILMNDPFVVQQAKVWAQRVLKADGREPRQRIATMYREALTRDATSAELDAAEQFLTRQARQYGLSGDRAGDDVRVWSDLAHVLFNVKEFIYVH